jgi:hypothetical protein
MNDEQLTQRMQAASEAMGLSDSAQARHLEAISAALSDGTEDGTVIDLSGAGAVRRRRFVASVIAAAVIAPTGLAAASEGSVPGEALYSVKQLSERVLVLFDSDVIARHRIEEIEALDGAGRFDPKLYDGARAALTELGEGHPLWERLAAVTGTDDGEDEPIVRDDDDRSGVAASAGPETVTLALPDGSEATFAIAGRDLVDVAPPTGWTVTGLDDDEATLSSSDFEVTVEVLADGSLGMEVIDRLDDDSSDAQEDAEGSAVTDDEASHDVQPTTTSVADDDDSESERNDDPGEDDPSTGG